MKRPSIGQAIGIAAVIGLATYVYVLRGPPPFTGGKAPTPATNAKSK